MERINYHIESVAQADKDWNNLVYMMDDIMKENPNLEPIVDAMMTFENFEGSTLENFESSAANRMVS